MSQQHSPSDLHATRQSLLAGQTHLQEIFEQASSIAQSEACRHVFMPGSAESPLLGALEPEAPPTSVFGDPALPLAGISVSIKDLFDVAGQTTAAGSTVLAGAAPAKADCPAVARLRAAGAAFAGRTNMVEFAFSGVGLNPHYGTPVNPAEPVAAIPAGRSEGRIPGGSSSGAAVSVATGAALVGLGSDTGGSIRIPAALCGIVGFKSTARLVPTTGTVPLSSSLDTVCALTRSVRDAITVHEVLAARSVQLTGKPLSACRLAVARTQMQDGLSGTVSKAFERSLRVLRQAGARIEEIALEEIGELAAINASGGLSAAQSHAWHRTLIAEHQTQYDPRVAQRILRGARMSAADYIDLLAARQAWIARMETRLNGFDAILSPTVPIVAPSIASVLKDDDEFFRINGLLLRNTAVVNMLDGCAISLPCHTPDQLPVGLMLWQAALHDDALLDLALQVEAALTQSLQKE
ncbi:aspartyl-tRNA(Asn)/glutamyl-tRNA(Gln) amidotransferase subunit A [Polaromonas sp. OV174]|uniref:amidase n=1 Tax=Polaromonas sp. OV174 TaxID=1855300 RepID=UPI0008EB6223|nr:amidase [Polaromonas sp. OV174]SFB97265.1 aspartyl-tRNA(Asn)/glutamyl-tRNA(Gln) amidotransferase subunit A [Polaromonas sp. OV174]